MSTSTSGAALVDRGFLRFVAILAGATCAFLLAATTAAASVVPSRNATTVATAITDASGCG